MTLKENTKITAETWKRRESILLFLTIKNSAPPRLCGEYFLSDI
jgi:hypothetical protein